MPLTISAYGFEMLIMPDLEYLAWFSITTLNVFSTLFFVCLEFLCVGERIIPLLSMFGSERLFF